MKMWVRILLTLLGLVLLATEIFGDVPGAALGLVLIAAAWAGEIK